jgi:serine/threonine-protein kinase
MTDDPAGWSRAAGVFHDARERPAPEREAFLDSACGGDRALKAEVESLLAADSGAAAFLAADGPGVAALLLDGEADEMRPGTLLGPYRVVRPLGRGGMGAVYLAEDTRLARPVTVKVLRPGEVADEQRRRRLQREARAAAALAHPNVAAVHALEDIGGQLALVAEYVPGRTARDCLDAAGRLPVTEALEIARQVARGLEAAHRAGIVHRDLKPENILVGDNGTVRILDFGIAREVTADAAGPRLTATGMLVGTPAYMAPEQLEGGTGDARSDLFALGIVIYELVTGANPFQGRTPSSTAARILTVEPAPPSSLDPLFPPALDTLVATCLKKDPSLRYASAAQVAEDLDAVLDALARGASAAGPGRPRTVSATEPSARALWRTHHAVVVALLSIIAIGSWWLAAWVGQPLRYTVFAAVLALCVAEGTMRVHLLFVERQTPRDVPRQLARSGPWLLRLDLANAVIVTLSASRVVADHQAAGTFLLALSVGMAVAAWVIEPATTEAAFPDAPSRRG